METLGWLVEAILTVDVWRSASSTCGELSVMIPGQVLMPEWFADSWDIQELVSSVVAIKSEHLFTLSCFILPHLTA